MGKIYLFGIVVLLLSYTLNNNYGPFINKYSNPFAVILLILLYLIIIFLTIISFFDEHFPDSRITKFIKRLFEWIVSGF
jgi:hypothetical protein